MEYVFIGEFGLYFIADFIDGSIGFLLGLESDSFEVFLKVFDGFDEERLEAFINCIEYFVIVRVV